MPKWSKASVRAGFTSFRQGNRTPSEKVFQQGTENMYQAEVLGPEGAKRRSPGAALVLVWVPSDLSDGSLLGPERVAKIGPDIANITQMVDKRSGAWGLGGTCWTRPPWSQECGGEAMGVETCEGQLAQAPVRRC
jgi:hypothetical protein